MSTFSGEQIAQVNNPDPFAVPVWRSPVLPHARLGDHHRPALAGCWRPWSGSSPGIRVIDLAAAGAGRGLVATGLARPGRPGRWSPPRSLAGWRWRWPRLVRPVRRRPGAGQVAALALPAALGRGHDHRPPGPGLPGPSAAAGARQGHLDPVHRPGAGPASCPASRPRTSPAAPRTWPTGSARCMCRVRTGRPGLLVLEFVRRDALAAIIPALPIPAHADLRALPVGRREDGSPWTGPAARHPPADRRGHRRREGLGDLGADPRPAPRPARRAGPASWPPTRS